MFSVCFFFTMACDSSSYRRLIQYCFTICMFLMPHCPSISTSLFLCLIVLQHESDHSTNTLVLLLYVMQPKLHVNDNTLDLFRGFGVREHHSVSAVFVLLLNSQIYRQERFFWIVIKKNPPGILLCAWLTTHPSPSSFCLRERRRLSHACQKAGGNNSPGGVSHRGPPAEPGTPCGGEWESSPPLLLKTPSPLYSHSYLTPPHSRELVLSSVVYK